MIDGQSRFLAYIIALGLAILFAFVVLIWLVASWLIYVAAAIVFVYLVFRLLRRAKQGNKI